MGMSRDAGTNGGKSHLRAACGNAMERLRVNRLGASVHGSYK